MPRARNLLLILASLTVFLIVLNAKSFSNDSIDYYEESKSSKYEKKNETKARSQTQRYVTPSLSELGIRGIPPMINKHVLMLTRIPGTGAELLILLLQRLQGYNAFKHIRLPPGDGGLLSSLQQELLIEEITGIIRQEAIPLSFDGDIRFLNFSQFGRQAPVLISMVRDPVNLRNLYRNRGGSSSIIYRGAISHFCGQDPRCTGQNNRWPLEHAKKNVQTWYSVVGILEHMEETLDKLENEFPYFFRGVKEIYGKIQKQNKIKKFNYPVHSKSFMEKMREVFNYEMEFYSWLKARLLNGTSDNG